MDEVNLKVLAAARLQEGEEPAAVIHWLWDTAYQAGSMKVDEESVTLSQEEYARLKNFEVTRLSVQVGYMEGELERAESTIRQLTRDSIAEHKAPEDAPKTRPPGWGQD